MAGDGSAHVSDPLRVLARRWWVVALATVVIGGAALAGAMARTPVYESTTDLLVERQVTSSMLQPINDALFGDQELATQIEVLTSLPVAQRTAERIGGLTAEDVMRRVEAHVIEDTHVIRISARSTDPAQAMEIAQTVTESYLQLRRERALERVLGQSSGLAEASQAIRDRVAEIEVALRRSPGDIALTQERDALLEQLGQLSAQGTAIESTQAALGGGQVLRPASASVDPVEPRPLRQLALGLVLGFCLGVAISLLADRVDDRARTPEAVAASAGHPVLASMPKLGSDPGLQMTTTPYGHYAEATRTLLANLRLSAAGRDARVLVVTSPGPEEGKSTTAVNLAVASALAGVRTVLIDGDLRRPRLHGFFGTDPGAGLAEVLRGDQELSTVLRKPDIANLRWIPAGTRTDGPAELLSGPALRDALTACAAAAELVVIDAPPTLGFADVLALSVRADATLLVVDQRRATGTSVKRAVDQLERVGAVVAGIAVNRASEDAEMYGYAGH